MSASRPLAIAALLAIVGIQTAWAQAPKLRAVLNDGHIGLMDAADWLHFSPDDSLLASWTRSGNVRVWDLASRSNIATIPSEAPVAAAQFDPKSELLYVACRDGRGLAWSKTSGRTTELIEIPPEKAKRLAWSFDCKALASSGDDGSVYLWDVASGKLKASFAAKMKRSRSGDDDLLEFVRDDSALVSLNSSELLVIDVKAESVRLQTNPASAPAGRGAALSADGKFLAMSCPGPYPGIFRLKVFPIAGREGATLVESTPFARLAFSPDGATVAALHWNRSNGSNSTAISLFQTNTKGNDRAEKRDLLATLGANQHFVSLAVSPSGKTLAASSSDGTIRLFDVATGQTKAMLSRWQRPVHAVTVSPDGKYLATESLPTDKSVRPVTPGVVRIFDLESNKLLAHLEPAKSPVFSRDGTQLAAISSGGVRLWKTSDWSNESEMGDRVGRFTLSRDGKQLATSSGANVSLWDTASGKTSKTLPGRKGDVTSLWFHPDGKLLIVAAARGIDLWELPEGKSAGSPNTTGPIVFAQMNPDRSLLALGTSARWFVLWNVEERKETAEIPRFAGIGSTVTFSPDGKRVAAAHIERGTSGRIHLFDAATGKTTDTTPEQKGRRLSKPAFSEDGRFLAFGGDDGIVRIWDLAANQEFAALNGNHGNVVSVAFTPNGERLISAGENGSLRVWDLPKAKAKD